MPLLEAEEEQSHCAFVCHRSETVFSAIEKCLDNGLGTCLIVEDDQKMVGRISLDDIRRAIMDGSVIENPTLDFHLKAGAGRSGNRLLNDVTVNDAVLQPVLTPSGRLTGIGIDRSLEYIQVAKPDLSHHEFRAVLDAFISSWISSKGPYIGKFEEEFSAFIGQPHGVAVSNGTVALHLALLALGIGPGDEVIIPDLTFAATINAVLYCGATPVIVDIDPKTWCMNLSGFAAACTSRTKAVIPVHLYGRPAEIGPIAAHARRRNIHVIEDCAEAHGARYDGKTVGQFSDIACFSFYANKIVTTGEGGMCLTASDHFARTLRELRDHGMTPGRSYWHERIGYNYRMTNLQAAIGQSQIWRIDRTLARNRRLMDRYREVLGKIPGVTFPPDLPAEYEPVIWLSCLQVPADKRDALLSAAHAAEIEMRPFFHPLSLLPPYERYARACPHSRALSETGLNLPTSRGVNEQVIDRIARLFQRVLS